MLMQICTNDIIINKYIFQGPQTFWIVFYYTYVHHQELDKTEQLDFLLRMSMSRVAVWLACPYP